MGVRGPEWFCTDPVICWRSLWRWGTAGQHRFSGRLMSHRLGLVPSFSCSFQRPGTCHLLLSAVQVWGRGGLLEVWMVVWRGVQSGCGVIYIHTHTHIFFFFNVIIILFLINHKCILFSLYLLMLLMIHLLKYMKTKMCKKASSFISCGW